MSKRPEGWDAQRLANLTLSEIVGVPVSANKQEVALVEAGADALEERLKASGQRVEKGDTVKFCRNYEGVGMKQYYAFTFEAPNIVCSVPEEPGE